MMAADLLPLSCERICMLQLAPDGRVWVSDGVATLVLDAALVKDAASVRAERYDLAAALRGSYLPHGEPEMASMLLARIRNIVKPDEPCPCGGEDLRCQVCCGNGEHNCSVCGGVHECGHCNGAGQMECLKCDGSGTIVHMSPIVMGSLTVDARRLLPHLSTAVLAVDGMCSLTCSPHALRVAGPGWDVYVMPLQGRSPPSDTIGKERSDW